MMKYVQSSVLSIIVLNILLITSTEVKSQCSGGTSTGFITPTASWQVIGIQGGQYRSFNATHGATYIFSFCQGGGSYSFDTQITILDNTGAIVAGAYNDDYCGTGSNLTFVAPLTATYRILITEWNCLANAAVQNLAYTFTIPPNDNVCSATYIYGNSCNCNYKTYSNVFATNSAQAAPSCATYNGGDIWFATRVPTSGKLNIFTKAGTVLTDGGMNVYKGTCTSLTSILCDDNSMPIGPDNLMPMMNLTGLTPGDSLFIRFYAKNNAQAGTFGICLVDPAPYYCMEGNATELSNVGNGRCIQVTPNKQGQQSCIWNTTQINMTNTFDYTYTVNLGNNDAGADGLTFTLQNNVGALSACGNPGWQLGIGPVTNSLIVEFDTFDNGPGAGDIAVDHTAININGNIPTPVAGPVQASSTAANIEDGLDHTVRVKWDPATMVFEVYFDGVFRLSYTNDIITNVFGGNPNVYWGFTGSTGLFTNGQSLCPGNLPGLPPTLPVTWGAFNAELMDDKAFISWTTLSESDNKEFIVERSQDGLKFEAIGSVKGIGNSSIAAKYQFMDPSPLKGTSYYRINQVDYNGAFSYSQAKSVNNTSSSTIEGNFCKIFPNPSSSMDGVTVQLEEDATLEIFDNLGNSILQNALTKGSNRVTGDELTSGIYHFVLNGANSVQSITLVVNGR